MSLAKFDAYRWAVLLIAVLTGPSAREKTKAHMYREGRRQDTYGHGLTIRNTAEGEASHHMSWKIKLWLGACALLARFASLHLMATFLFLFFFLSFGGMVKVGAKAKNWYS